MRGARRIPGQTGSGRLDDRARRVLRASAHADAGTPRRDAVIALAEIRADGLARPVPAEAAEIAASRVRRSMEPGDTLEIDDNGDLLLSFASPTLTEARRRLSVMARAVVTYEVETSNGPVKLEAGAGVEVRRTRGTGSGAREHALVSLAQRDLVPRPDARAGRPMPQLVKASGRTTVAQVALALFVSLVLPFLLLTGLYEAGLDASGPVHIGLLGLLTVMATLQWLEVAKAMKAPALPPVPDDAAPPASAVIAAYLPNEADTIVETVEAFLGLRYPGPLQIVLAYNTPTDLPVEQELRAIADRDGRLLLVRVPESRSKSQNVNFVIPLVTGEFVGIFDADHHPAAGAFERAWRWIASGADVVQGHCVIRNGDESAVARLVATEFEQIYAVSHPGRQRLHGFGIFGGSNGFWRIQALRETRFRTDFLTEDIEASIRAVRRGRRIVNDPGLLSRELAPTSLSQLWRQRMRWAQGWFQVSLRHGHGVPLSYTFSSRQRFGLGVLLLWREAFPWFSSLMWPLLAFYVWRDGSLSWNSSMLLLATLYTVVAGPVQVITARRLAVPEIRSRTSWWWAYGFATVLFYAEWKNLIARVAQFKQLMGEHQWVVTPRSASRAKPAMNLQEARG